MDHDGIGQISSFLQRTGISGDDPIPVGHDGGGSSVHVYRLIGFVPIHDVGAVFHCAAQAVSHLTSVYDEKEEFALFRLTDGGSWLQAPAVGALNDLVAVDDECRRKLQAPVIGLHVLNAPADVQAVVFLVTEEQIVVLRFAVFLAVQYKAADDGTANTFTAGILESAAVDGQNILLGIVQDLIAHVAEVSC